ncbi:YoaK family protein [Cupriavidus sp. 2TAF22]|uniref:YoaK family protein n=1 Tax=unclassified Cupriavidus TaxID=2640874 RepID=UPI003F9363A2
MSAGATPRFGDLAAGTRGCLLSFVAGYVDVVGFTALFGLFTAHVTGNFIMIGVELTGHSNGLMTKLLALPTFVVAVGATRLLERWLQGRQQPVVTVLIALECAFLLLFMGAGLEAPHAGADAALGTVAGLLAVTAMGIQNALSRTALADLGPTTIMTGNTTQIVIDMVDLAAATPEQKKAILARLRKMVPALAGFAAGAVLGALAFTAVSFWCVLLPVALLATLCCQPWQARLVRA